MHRNEVAGRKWRATCNDPEWGRERIIKIIWAYRRVQKDNAEKNGFQNRPHACGYRLQADFIISKIFSGIWAAHKPCISFGERQLALAQSSSRRRRPARLPCWLEQRPRSECLPARRGRRCRRRLCRTSSIRRDTARNWSSRRLSQFYRSKILASFRSAHKSPPYTHTCTLPSRKGCSSPRKPIRSAPARPLNKTSFHDRNWKQINFMFCKLIKPMMIWGWFMNFWILFCANGVRVEVLSLLFWYF